MIKNSTRRLSVVSLSLLATIAAVAVPAAAHAEMHEFPACTEMPSGGCQDGPLGNGSGGGGWGPWGPGGPLDYYSVSQQTAGGFTAWFFDRRDGTPMTDSDAVLLKYTYSFSDCLRLPRDSVICY
ncbi:hypothetical protein ITJ64_16110 [Herbiconiux sp. VKM Ac-1786]|uniref:hypothetical protein n=1 Tax=Herbiconiux sp. VKM Ac-1786 TaxID=2783824 RepID=UPI00188CFD89|nr:hypothetical protein [Herbiconiux sp. VKM Ac-1786]MBF4574038.1 hypothetical protein [Herbiconiux sp. VKM Ac-1786]